MTSYMVASRLTLTQTHRLGLSISRRSSACSQWPPYVKELDNRCCCRRLRAAAAAPPAAALRHQEQRVAPRGRVSQVLLATSKGCNAIR